MSIFDEKWIRINNWWCWERECQECCVKKETSPAWIGNSKTSNQASRDSLWIPDVLDSQIYRCIPSLASWQSDRGPLRLGNALYVGPSSLGSYWTTQLGSSSRWSDGSQLENWRTWIDPPFGLDLDSTLIAGLPLSTESRQSFFGVLQVLCLPNGLKVGDNLPAIVFANVP